MAWSVKEANKRGPVTYMQTSPEVRGSAQSLASSSSIPMPFVLFDEADQPATRSPPWLSLSGQHVPHQVRAAIAELP
ncbi:hypothetical protein MY4038_004349 [Beauveria bassiana]